MTTSLYVPPRGNPEARIAIVGEQPGFTEVRWNPPTPFVGPAGEALDSCLQRAKIVRKQCWITNVIKTLNKPLSAFVDLKHGLISTEGQEFINQLREELSSLPNLNVAIALGNVPLLALTSRLGITKWRGSVLESTLVSGLKVIPTFHPATIVPPKANYLNEPLIVHDLRRALSESEFKEISRLTRSLNIVRTSAQAFETLDLIHKHGREGAIIDFDIEVLNEELDCFSFAINPFNSWCFPLTINREPMWTVDIEYQLLKRVADIISDPSVSIRGANIIFDLTFLLNKYGIIPRGEIHCTQVAQKIITPDLPAGLDMVTSLHTDIPYYKADGKKWIKYGVGSQEIWWTYNALDAVATAAAHPKQMKELEVQGNTATYERQRKLIPPLIYMSYRGIRVNVEGLLKQKEKEERELASLEEEFSRLAPGVNPNSPSQLMDYFYKTLKISPYKKRTTSGWKPTVNKDALKRMARKGVEGAILLQNIRRLSKRLSTYMDISKIDPDGRYRSSYKPAGAETGRLASGTTIFGTGGNQQNWPHDLLQYFIFDDGYIGYSFDLSQAENRIVAYVGGIVQMIKAFEQGIDLHRLTAALIFRKPLTEVSDAPGSSDLGDGTHSERDWGKRANHSLNYDLGYKSFSLNFEMPENEGKFIVEAYHKAYPEVRNNYHAMIKYQLQTTRMVENCYGRKRLFLGPVIPNPPRVPASACDQTYKEAYAQIPQSTVADKMNEDGIEFIYYNDDPIFRYVELLTQIHDSIVFQVPLSLPWKAHADILLKVKHSLERLIYWHNTPIPLPADLSIGFNMYKKQMVEIKSHAMPTDIEVLASKLESVYGQLKQNAT